MENNEEQRVRWDLKYRQGLPLLTKPDPFFIFAYDRFVDESFPNAGAALDLAGGLGRHALWLARRNWKVAVVDVSDVAIRQLKLQAMEAKLRIEAFVGDAFEYEFQIGHFDLIVLFYHSDRALFGKIMSALKPGGLLLSKLSIRWVAIVPTPARFDLLNKGELPSLVPELKVLYCRERPARDRGVIEFVGCK